MSTFRIITASKKASETADSVEALLAEAYPDWRVENLVEENGEWKARLVQAAGEPPAFLKKKDDAPSDDAEDAPDDDASDEPDDEGDEPEDDGDEKPKGDKKDKGKGDPVKEVQKVIDELQGLLSDLGGKTQDLQNAHDEKADKLKEIGDTVGDAGGLGGEEGPDEIGPTPGGPPPGADGPPSGGPGGIPPIPKRPGVPSGGAPRPGVPSAFGKRRRTEIATHPGFDAAGNRLTLTAAMAELESDPRFRGYTVAQARQEGDKFVARLQLKG